MLFSQPLYFSDVISEEWDLEWNLYVLVFDWDEYGDSFAREYSIPPDSEAFLQFRTVLYEHTFHRSFRTYFADASALGSPNGFRMQIYSGKNSVTSSGTGEIVVNHHFFRMNRNAEHTMRIELMQILDEWNNQ